MTLALEDWPPPADTWRMTVWGWIAVTAGILLGLSIANRKVADEPAAERFAQRAGDTKLQVLLKTITEKIPTHAVIFDVSTDRGIRSGNQTLTNLPVFCRVVAVSRPSSDSNINFEVWLPQNTWNGKFLSSGEGGFAGALNYTRLGLDGGLDELLQRGYATASTDTGHVSTDTY